MPEPTFRDLHINRWMTNMAVMYRQEAAKFAAHQVFPDCPTEYASNDYLIFDRGYFMRDDMPERPMGAEPANDGYKVETGSFQCKERSLAHLIDDRVKANADTPANPDMRATQFLNERALIKLERDWCGEFFTASKWGTTWEGVTGTGSEAGKTFTNFSEEGTEPVLFFEERANEMESVTGFRPNVAVFGAEAFTAVKNNKEILERIKYISDKEPALFGIKALAAALGVDKVVVAKAVFNSAKEGEAKKIEYIANSKAAMLAYAAPAPSIDTPSAGYTFVWTSLIPGLGNATGGVLYSARKETAWSDWYAIRSSYDQKVVAPELGMFFENVSK